MSKMQNFRLWLAVLGTTAALYVIGMAVVAFIRDHLTNTLTTEDVDEAREFSRYCERVSDSYTLRPHWRPGEDTPYAYTIICGSHQSAHGAGD